MFSTFFTKTINTKIETITGTGLNEKISSIPALTQPWKWILELGSGSNYSNAKNRKAIPH
jgi:hypothetical protein